MTETITVAALSIRLRRLERAIEAAIEAELRGFREDTGLCISSMSIDLIDVTTIEHDGPQIVAATVRAMADV